MSAPILCRFDHLVFASHSLEAGKAYLRSSLSVELPDGGRHQRFGTHNALMQLATPGIDNAYFELIAIDPDASPASRPRWFALDEPDVQQQLVQQPRLLTWVVSTPDLGKAQSWLGPMAGEIIDMQRGELNWRMLMPHAGRHHSVVTPWLIEWPEGVHPAPSLADLGWQLDKMSLQLPAETEPVELTQAELAGDLGPVVARIFASQSLANTDKSSRLSASLVSPGGNNHVLEGVVW